MPYTAPHGMAPGCCSAASPCNHQKNDPTTICDVCQKAADLYRFECPECGFSDKEAGSLAEEAQVHCGMCAGDTGKDVRLRRWKADEALAR
jgi:hypothetical protein